MDVELRRPQAQERMHAEALVARAEVARRADGVAAGERALAGPPQRHLAPRTSETQRQELERPEALLGDDVVRDPQPARDRGAVPVVPVEQLDDADHVFELFDSRPVDRVDDPRSAIRAERVRGALEELVLDPLRYGNHNSAQRSTRGKPFALASAISASTSYGMLRNSTASVSSSTSAYSHRRAVPTAPTQNHSV